MKFDWKSNKNRSWFFIGIFFLCLIVIVLLFAATPSSKIEERYYLDGEKLKEGEIEWVRTYLEYDNNFDIVQDIILLLIGLAVVSFFIHAYFDRRHLNQYGDAILPLEKKLLLSRTNKNAITCEFFINTNAELFLEISEGERVISLNITEELKK